MVLHIFALFILLISLLIFMDNFSFFEEVENNLKMPTRWPLISILIPARNEEKNIPRCLKAVLSQDYPNFEVIVYDDQSTDNTPILLREFAKKYSFSIEFFKKDEINSINIDLSKSQATKFFGLKGVAEPSAILLSKHKELIIKKEVYNKTVTIAGAI